MKNQSSRIMLICLIAVSGCRQSEPPRVEEAVEIQSSHLIPDANFHVALELFVAKEYRKSAEAIEDAATEMEQLSRLAGPAQKQNILSSVADLRDLATDVSTDHVDGIEELNYYFAEAGKNLAGMYAETTETSYFNLQGRLAGEQLEKVIDQIELNLRYHGRESTAEEKELFGTIRKFSAKLRHGESTNNEEIEKYLMQIREYLAKNHNEILLKFGAVRDKRKTVVRKSS